MHTLLGLLVMYLFGAWIFMLWEADPVITTLAVGFSIVMAIIEDMGK